MSWLISIGLFCEVVYIWFLYVDLCSEEEEKVIEIVKLWVFLMFIDVGVKKRKSIDENFIEVVLLVFILG